MTIMQNQMFLLLIYSTYSMNKTVEPLRLTINRYDTGMSGLPDMYTQSPRAEAGNIGQTTSDCITTIM